VDRGDVDHPSPAALVHAGQDRPGQAERGLHHQRQHGREALGRELLDGGDVLEPGVVDQDVGGQLDAVEAGRVGQVGGHGDAAELAGDPLGAGLVQVDHGHPGPGAGQPAGAGLADAAGPAGDQRGPAVQVDVHGASSSAAHGRSSYFWSLPRALRGNAST
jgi:hypothetical protein